MVWELNATSSLYEPEPGAPKARRASMVTGRGAEGVGAKEFGVERRIAEGQGAADVEADG